MEDWRLGGVRIYPFSFPFRCWMVGGDGGVVVLLELSREY
jgi:hypothetical protein